MNSTIHNIEESAILEVLPLRKDQTFDSTVEGKLLAEFITSHIPLNTFCEALAQMEKLCPNSVDAMKDSLLIRL